MNIDLLIDALIIGGGTASAFIVSLAPQRLMKRKRFDIDKERAAQWNGFWRDMHYNTFPNTVSHERVPDGDERNKRGIDFILRQDDDSELWIEEKTEEHRNKPKHIPIELEAHGKAGWAMKALDCDWLAYGFVYHGHALYVRWSAFAEARDRCLHAWMEDAAENTRYVADYRTKQAQKGRPWISHIGSSTKCIILPIRYLTRELSHSDWMYIRLPTC